MKRWLIISAVAILTFCVATTGILGVWFYDAKVKPVKAYESASTTVKDFKTANFTLSSKMNMKMEMVLGRTKTTVTSEIKMDGTGAVDYEKSNVQMKLNTNNKMNSGNHTQEQNIKLEEIVIGAKDIYMKFDDKQFKKVTTDELTSDSGFSMDDLKNNEVWGSLKNTSNYEYMGKEVVDGKNAYKYKVIVNESDVEKVYSSIFDEIDTLGLSEDPKFETKVDGIEMFVWVDISREQPLMESITIKSLEIKDNEFITINVENMVVNMKYDKINEPVNIQAPKI